MFDETGCLAGFKFPHSDPTQENLNRRLSILQDMRCTIGLRHGIDVIDGFFRQNVLPLLCSFVCGWLLNVPTTC